MRLRPRQYVLMLIIILLGIYNLVRLRHRHQEAAANPGRKQMQTQPGTSPVWSLYDTAAGLRDAADAQFQPALQALKEGIDNANAVSVPPQVSSGELADLKGCETWLLFYRQDFLHPATNKPGWREQTLQHVTSCATGHRDAAQ